MRVRYRLATRLLGYRPIPVPDGDAVYIVIRHADHSLIVTAKTLTMDVNHTLPTWSDSGYAEYHPASRTGSFSGTL